jgi:hypothetical protein
MDSRPPPNRRPDPDLPDSAPEPREPDLQPDGRIREPPDDAPPDSLPPRRDEPSIET